MLSQAEFHVDGDIRVAKMLPASAFKSKDFLELELRTIFTRTWLLVPSSHARVNESESLAGLLTRPGSHVPFSLLSKPLFLQRDLNGKLHCFPNVCTHAWHPLVLDAGVARGIVCPQHGRCFDTKGKFVSQPGFKNLKKFPRESDNLIELPVEQWGDLFFVNLGKPTARLGDILKVTKESTGRLPLEDFRPRPHKSQVREVKGNWKQHAWNYMDNFHIRFVHGGPGGLADAIDLTSYKTELYRYSSLQWAYARRPEDGFEAASLPARFHDPKKRVFALWWFVFPNLTLNMYPWGLSVNLYTPIPGRPERTRFFWFQYAWNEEKFARRNETWLAEQVDAEDIDAIALVDHGARSGFATRGRFAPEEETGPHWFHRLVYEFVFEQGQGSTS